MEWNGTIEKRSALFSMLLLIHNSSRTEPRDERLKLLRLQQQQRQSLRQKLLPTHTLCIVVYIYVYIFAEYFIERHILCTILFVFDSVVRFVHCAGYLYYVRKFMSRCRYCKFVDLFYLVFFSFFLYRFYYYSFSHRIERFSFFYFFYFDVLLGNSQIFQAYSMPHLKKMSNLIACCFDFIDCWCNNNQ